MELQRAKETDLFSNIADEIIKLKPRRYACSHSKENVVLLLRQTLTELYSLIDWPAQAVSLDVI